MPVLDGVSYTIAQPCLDLAAQMKVANIQNLGIVGDLSHQAGCGDHVPWECTGHYGWITAIDIGWDGYINGVRVTPALLRKYLLPRLRAHTWEFYLIKYIITGRILNDTRPPYNLRDQSGSDGDDHMHISFLNSAIRKRCTLIQDFIAWVKAGMPNPVTFDPRAIIDTGDAKMDTIVLKDGRPALFFIDVNGHPVVSYDEGQHYAVISSAKKYSAGISLKWRGDGLIAAVRDQGRGVHMLHIPNPVSPADGFRDQWIGGTSACTPGVAVLPDNSLLFFAKSTLAVDFGAPYRKKIYANGAVEEWSEVEGRAL